MKMIVSLIIIMGFIILCITNFGKSIGLLGLLLNLFGLVAFLVLLIESIRQIVKD